MALVSSIYRNTPSNKGKVNKSQVWESRPSDIEKTRKGGKPSIHGQDVFLADGMLSCRNVRHNEYGYFITLNGHDIKVRHIGGNAWIQRDKELNQVKLVLHPQEQKDRGIINKVPVYREYHAGSKIDVSKPIPSKQRGLKSKYTNTCAMPSLDRVCPTYKRSIESSGASASKEAKDRITATAGVTPELEVWLKTVGKKERPEGRSFFFAPLLSRKAHVPTHIGELK